MLSSFLLKSPFNKDCYNLAQSIPLFNFEKYFINYVNGDLFVIFRDIKEKERKYFELLKLQFEELNININMKFKLGNIKQIEEELNIITY